MNFTFLSDIDGTLVKTNHPLSRATIDAAQAFVDAKGYLALCTGREIRSAGGIARMLPVNAPCILCGGGMIYDFTTHKILWMQALDAQITEVIDTVFRHSPSVSIAVYTDKGIHTIRTNRFIAEHGVFEDRTAPLCKLSELQGGILKVLLTCEEIPVLEELRETVIDPDLFEYAFAARRFCEITPKGINKGTSMLKLAERMQLPGNHFFAAGDAATDLTMRKNADWFFAPETAPDIVRASADHIIPGPAESGMAQAFARAIRYMEESRTKNGPE